MRTASIVVACALAGLALLGCSDDDDGGGIEAYCELWIEIDEQEASRTEENLNELADLAPSKISDQVDILVDAFTDEDPEAILEPEVEGALVRMKRFGTDNCLTTVPTDNRSDTPATLGEADAKVGL
jgi:hypothetical protein